MIEGTTGMRAKAFGATLAIAALWACDRAPVPPAPTPAPSADATGGSAVPEGEKVSIIRPDVSIEREAAPPLAPLALRIGFEEGGAQLSQAATAALEKVLASDQMKAGGAIALGGHTDSAGTDEANLRAAQKRADVVRAWLVDHGVPATRIAVIAFGEQNPAAPNARPDGTPDVAGRAKNRRVELMIAVPKGTPPAAIPRDSGTLVDELTTAE